MFGIHGYLLFLVTGILLNLTPGQDTMFIIGKSLTGGRRAGAAAALGISVGSVFHTLAAALGLSALLAASALAFTIVKLAGAAYLFYLGMRLLLVRSAAGKPETTTMKAGAQSRSAFVQGIFTNVLNPKVALFFLALLPQFIDPGSPSKTAAFLLLGGTFITTGLIWCLVIAFGAARLQIFFQKNPDMRTLINRVVGGLFVAMSVRLAWAR